MLFLIGFLSGLLAGTLATFLLILWYTVPRLERLYVFRPSRDLLKTPKDWGIPFDQCFFELPDGPKLSAWHLCPENPRGSVVYFHGNGGNLGILNEIFAMLYRHRLQVFAFDYRGYGWSTGSPSEEGVYRDGLAAVEYFLANFRREGLPLLYWGRSLGGCVAAHASSQIPPSGLILETSFPSKKELLEEYPRLRPFQWFSRYQLETVAPLRDHDFPILVMHGDKDRTVPLKQGQLLYQRLNPPKEFYLVEGAGHVDIHMLDSDKYMRRVLRFVDSVRPLMIH